MIIVDCSIIIAATLNDETNHLADKLLKKLINSEIQAIVPVIFHVEVTNVLFNAFRKKRINNAIWVEYQEAISSLPIETDLESAKGDKILELSILCEKYQLSAYDASYLELALRKNAKLATLDKTLYNAAIDCKVVYH